MLKDGISVTVRFMNIRFEQGSGETAGLVLEVAHALSLRVWGHGPDTHWIFTALAWLGLRAQPGVGQAGGCNSFKEKERR